MTDIANSAATVDRKKTRYILIGGFLGAGKTTAIIKLASWLTNKGFRVGLITNDQANNLVDTSIVQSHGYPGEEISGGCFCCKFNSLQEANRRLAEAYKPDVFIAEPVGSCTDLVATVAFPLRQLFGDNYTVSPLSVLVDPIRAERVFSIQKSGNFSDRVIYIYLKQIEEADIVVINKCELLTAQRLASLKEAILEKFPAKEVITVSARLGTNLENWFEKLLREELYIRPAMDVDYEVYADGEAKLGWLNAIVKVSSQIFFDANDFLKKTAVFIQQKLNEANIEIAHLKMTFSPSQAISGEICSVNLVRNDFVPELSYELENPVKEGRLIINLRAESDPEFLEKSVRESISKTAELFSGLEFVILNLDRFRPGKPVPTYRINGKL